MIRQYTGAVQPEATNQDGADPVSGISGGVQDYRRGPDALAASSPPTNLDAALAYAQQGLAVVPNHAVEGGICSCSAAEACRSPGKHPLTPHGVTDASADLEIIKRWWSEYPSAGVGIATGRVSRVLVIDIDPGNGGDQTFAQLEALHGRLPPTVTCRTGSGGRHFYLKRPETDAHIVSAPHGLGKGVDLRVDGAQVIAPPTVHHSGHRYAWEAGKAPGEVELAELPVAWRKLLPTRTANDGKAQRRGAQQGVTGPSPQPLTKDDHQLLRNARSAQNSEKFSALWRGNLNGFPSASEADLSLCSMLAFWTRKNSEQMDRLFRHSGRMRKKWDEVHFGDSTTYGQHTIETAIDNCSEVYHGSTLFHLGGRSAELVASTSYTIPGGAPTGSSYCTDSVDEKLDQLVRAGSNCDDSWRAIRDVNLIPAHCREHFDSLWFAAQAEYRFHQSALVPGHFALTDLGNAERLVALFGRLVRHVAKWKKWLVWTGCRWKVDDSDHMMRLARRTARSIYEEAKRATGSAEKKQLAMRAVKSESERSLKAMIKIAGSDAAVSIRPSDLDRDRWLLNCVNGTVDLRTGTLRAHSAEDLLTKITSVEFDPNAKCRRWIRFLMEIFRKNMRLIKFIQRYVGMTLTGDITEQILLIFSGPGSNGKSVLVDTIVELLGDFATIAAPDLLVSGVNDRHPTEIADLAGRRLVVASETDEGRRLRIAFVKSATGDKRQKARRMREDFWSFDREYKVILSTNNLPRIREETHAIWRRIRVVPFNVIFDEKDQDKELLWTLRNEWSGILAWAVRGCLEWQRGGLRFPPAVTDATQAYRQQEDLIEQFLMDCCTLGSAPSIAVTRKAIRKAYQKWARDVDERATLGRNAFYERLRMRPGIEEYRCSQWRGFTGVCLTRLEDFLEHEERKAEDEFIGAVVRAKTPSAMDLCKQLAGPNNGSTE